MGAPELGRREVGGRVGRKDVDGRAGKDVLEREGPNDIGVKIVADEEEALKRKDPLLTLFAPSSLIKNGGVKKRKEDMVYHEISFTFLVLH